jgi:hypothetical protein
VENERFDAVIRALSNGATRRGALGLLAGLASLGLGETVVTARRKGKAKRRRNRKRQVQAAAANKVTVCHYAKGSDTYHRISISSNGKAVEKHLANHVSDDGTQGDFVVGASGCCTDEDCTGAGESCVIAVDDDGTRSGTCEVDCSAAANGTPCGTQVGAGTVRCCNGTCPSETPPCRPVGTPCLPGEDGITCQQQCCSRNRNAFTNACQGNTPDPNGNRCASDTDCRPEFNATCQCEGCCNGPGVVPYTSTTCGGCRDCRSCCSGDCVPDAVICA